ncbi:MAG: flippase-like domain-containing protein [Phycisphaerales bacterium]|nr:flippase-like domain-containing protein [Phycisphaerales bacterium]
MNKSAKKWISRLVKFAVCAGALWYLSTKVSLDDYVRLAESPETKYRLVSQSEETLRIRDVDGGHVREVSRHAVAKQEQLKKDQRPIELGLKTIVRTTNWSWTGWALLSFGPVTFILSWRLRLLLATQGIQISYVHTLLLTFAGNFFNFAMPGTTGGDLYKAYHIAKRTHKRTEGVTVVILDRAIGLISFLLIAVVAIGVAGVTGTTIIGTYGTWVGLTMVALMVGGMLFFSNRVRRWIRYDAWLGKLPFADKLKRIDETAFSFRYHRPQALISLGVTLLSHCFIVTCIYFLARGFGIHPNLGRGANELYMACTISTAVGFLFAAVPISVQGFGLLEAVFFKVMVEGQWSNASQMLALTLGARLVQIVWSLPGLLVPWLGMERPSGVSDRAPLGSNEVSGADMQMTSLKPSQPRLSVPKHRTFAASESD